MNTRHTGRKKAEAERPERVAHLGAVRENAKGALR